MKDDFKKWLRIFEIFLGVDVVTSIIKSLVDAYNEILSDESLIESCTSNIINIIPCAFGGLFLAVIENILLVAVFVALLLSSRSARIKVLDETDFEKNKKYFRDIIKDYSASELNYIDDFKLEKKQSYTAKLLELEKNKIIKISDGKITKLKEPDSLIDKKFIDSIENNKVTMPMTEYEELVEKSALDAGLIIKSGILDKFKDKKTIIIMTIIFVLMFAYALWVALIQPAEDIYATLFLVIVFLVIVGVVFFAFVVTFTISYFIQSAISRKYKRTEKGKEINMKLDGLKAFMDEFSNINNKESQHLVLWEDYLIYSVMFNINKKIQDEYSQYF